MAITLELSDRMPFWDRTIELVVLTHPQSDHITGLVEVLKDYQVKQVLYPDLDCDLAIYEEFLRLIDEKDIKVTMAQAGQQFELGGVVIDVLNLQNPLLSSTESDIDNNSVVLHISMDAISFMLTADLMWEGEFELISQRFIPPEHRAQGGASRLRYLYHPRVLSCGKSSNSHHIGWRR